MLFHILLMLFNVVVAVDAFVAAIVAATLIEFCWRFGCFCFKFFLLF